MIVPSGITATDSSKAGFVVFDRGTPGSHDAFYIAAIQTVDASGNPSAYYNAVEVQPTVYGNGVGGNVTYLILRRNPTDSHLLMMDNSGSQNRDGVLLRFSDLGVPSKTKINGYSLMGIDVLVTPASNMVDYTNATNFPINSDYGTLGGLDPLAVTGLWITNTTYIILPEWIEAFDAHLQDNAVALDWQLGVDGDTRKLVVERSPDGHQYAPVFTLSEPASAPSYTLDEHPLPGVNYYRLTPFDDQGIVIAYSAVSSVTVPALLSIYPNPAVGKQLSIHATGLAQGAYDLRVFDLKGSPVYSGTVQGGALVDQTVRLPGSPTNGTYMVQLLSKDGGVVITKKIALL